ncbi:hypothetical protein F4776DRAFT_663210 [Hypoxylon sp. NC0597]|nr:hypothetical protein F4776DRAFT_663210 [Hypoxylon sp. NC0597]
MGMATVPNSVDWETPGVLGKRGDHAETISNSGSPTRALSRPKARHVGLALRAALRDLAFFISFCMHGWQSFTTARRDNGEFAFLMSQPVIITVEDFVR